MKDQLLSVNDFNLSCRIQSLLEDAYYDQQESTQLQDFRKLFDWEERFCISYLSRDGKDGVIQHDTIYEMKEVYESQYRPDISEVEWSLEPDDDCNSGCVESDGLIIDVRNVVLRDRSLSN